MLGKNIKLREGRGREYYGCGEEYNVGKGKQCHPSFDIKAVGKNIEWGRGEGDGHFGEKAKILKKDSGEEYQVVGNFIHPWKITYLVRWICITVTSRHIVRLPSI